MLWCVVFGVTPEGDWTWHIYSGRTGQLLFTTKDDGLVKRMMAHDDQRKANAA